MQPGAQSGSGSAAWRLGLPDVGIQFSELYDAGRSRRPRGSRGLFLRGILSKRKYCSIRSSEMFDYDVVSKKRTRSEFSEGCKIPAILPYKDVMKFVNEQDIGRLNGIPRSSAE